MRKKMLKENLFDVDMQLSRFDIPHFLIGGTLLGAIREKNFLEWDKDIDLGIFADKYIYLNDIYNALKQLEILGFTVTKFYSSVITLDRGIRVDIFPFFTNSSCHYLKLGNYCLEFPLECLPQLEPIQFCDKTFCIPSKSESFLLAQYGPDWKKPNQNWNLSQSLNLKQ